MSFDIISPIYFKVEVEVYARFSTSGYICVMPRVYMVTKSFVKNLPIDDKPRYLPIHVAVQRRIQGSEDGVCTHTRCGAVENLRDQ